MTDEISRKQKILEEIIQEAQERHPGKKPGEFSRYEFAKMIGSGRNYAERVLEEKIKAGEIKARVTRVGTTYYSIV